MASSSSAWRSIAIFGPRADAVGVILCPLVALAVMELVWRYSGLSDDRVYTVLFGFIVTGHHMPGWIRAWGEPAIYQRHKARLWVSAFAIPAMVITPAALGLGVLVGAVASIFDLWHTSMQQHGFARIYSGKAGDVDKRAARLELGCVLSWYLTVVAWSDSWAMGIASSLHKAGLGVFDGMSVTTWRSVRAAFAAISLTLLGLYVAHAVRVWREKRVVAIHKHAVHAVMFLVALYAYRAGSWYRAQSVQNLFHASQYFFMVWVFGNLSIKRAATKPGPVYRTIFGRWWGAALFGALVLLYGGLSFVLPDAFASVPGAESRRFELASSVVAASLLLHFYVDSFIWKVRERDVRKALDLSPGATAAASDESSQWKGALHATAYFGVPLLAVALLGASGRAHPQAGESAWIAHAGELFPNSGGAQLALGKLAIEQGRPREAREALERAYAVAPTLPGTALSLADLDEADGRRADSLAHLRAAARAVPEDAHLHLSLAVALGQAGELAEAERELRTCAALAPTRPEPHVELAVLERDQRRFDDALAELAIARALGPDSPRVVVESVVTLALRGDKAQALALASAFLETHPTHAGLEQLRRDVEAGRVGPKP